MKNVPAFVEYALQHFGVELEYPDVWKSLDDFDLTRNDPLYFTKELLYEYTLPTREKHPDLEKAARPLFFSILQHAGPLKDPPLWSLLISQLLPLMTQVGLADMSKEEAGVLAPLLRPRLQFGTQAQTELVKTLFHSSALWAQLKDETVQACTQGDPTLIRELNVLQHRHQPESTGIDARQTQNLYLRMCGADKYVRPTLVEMQSILIPLHHRPEAWTIALANCEDPAPGTWMQLAPSFSSMPIAPDNASAWSMFNRLRETAQTDPSCMQLLQTLENLNPDMVKAYTELWPSICSVYDGEERETAAAQIWRSTPLYHQNSLDLPDLSLD